MGYVESISTYLCAVHKAAILQFPSFGGVPEGRGGP
jgi:hypothetical protein